MWSMRKREQRKDVTRWFRLHDEIEELMRKAKAILNRVDAEEYFNWVWVNMLYHELRVLLNDLNSYSPYDEIDYAEFTTRLARIRKEIEAVEKKLK